MDFKTLLQHSRRTLELSISVSKREAAQIDSMAAALSFKSILSYHCSEGGWRVIIFEKTVSFILEHTNKLSSQLDL